MTSEEAATQEPPQETRRWSTRRSLAVVAVALVIGGLGGAAIYAATGGSSRMLPGPQHIGGPPMPGPPPGPGGPKGPGGPPSLAALQSPDVLHSEYVESDGHGGFVTKMTQTGTVDEVTLSTIVVRSADGYTQIYAFPSSAVVPAPSLAAGDTVTVQATRNGATVTLNSIGDQSPHEN
ncbi:hypothetical protein DVS77_13975 [Mycolicibacterium moriokaense]|nr:hypothetical protein DVS77_13975 [Mycolicibacterium moriokaense]